MARRRYFLHKSKDSLFRERARARLASRCRDLGRDEIAWDWWPDGPTLGDLSRWLAPSAAGMGIRRWESTPKDERRRYMSDLAAKRWAGMTKAERRAKVLRQSGRLCPNPRWKGAKQG